MRFCMLKLNFLIVGFGNMGMRHAQGIIKASEILNIESNVEVLDPYLNTDDFDFSCKKVSLVEKPKKDYFSIIISTTALYRFNALLDIFDSNCTAKYIILEKNPFTSISQIENVEIELKNRGLYDSTYVNTPFSQINEIKQYINFESSDLVIDIESRNYGLLTNSIHIILPILAWGNSSILSYSSSEPAFYNAQRESCIECFADFILVLGKNKLLKYKEFPKQSDQKFVNLTCDNKNIKFDFKTSSIVLYTDGVITNTLPIPLQSDFSWKALLSDMINDNVKLPSVNKAFEFNRMIIEMFLGYYNRYKNDDTNEQLPLT